MAPGTKVTKDMIIEAGMQVIRSEGIQALNVRKIASVLRCSTQPVMYHFSTVEALKAELYQAADVYHSSYLMQADFASSDPILAIGLRYILFAAEERNLFRFLFQSDQFANSSFNELTSSEALAPIFMILQEQAGLSTEQSREAFSALFLAVHGIASLLANNSMEYDEKYCVDVLTNIFIGVIGIMKGEA